MTNRELSRRPCLALAVAALGSLAGCATTAADFHLDSLRPDDAALVGKIDVIYNGKPYTDRCQVSIGQTAYKLDKSGLVLLKMTPGVHPLRVACMDTSPYHYAFQDANFVAQGNGTLTYFGNATITWTTSGGLKASSLFGAIGAAVDAASNDGDASMDVADDPRRVQPAIVERIGRIPTFNARLLTRGK